MLTCDVTFLHSLSIHHISSPYVCSFWKHLGGCLLLEGFLCDAETCDVELSVFCCSRGCDCSVEDCKVSSVDESGSEEDVNGMKGGSEDSRLSVDVGVLILT